MRIKLLVFFTIIIILVMCLIMYRTSKGYSAVIKTDDRGIEIITDLNAESLFFYAINSRNHVAFVKKDTGFDVYLSRNGLSAGYPLIVKVCIPIYRSMKEIR